MQVSGLDRVNYINIAAMLFSAALAIIIPFELVLLSYAILGPGHYLTEISWLKGRQFFTLKKYDYLIILGTVLIAYLVKLPTATLVFYAFGMSLILLAIKSNVYRFFAAAILIVAGYFLLNQNILRAIFGLYVPTLIHVYIFTGAFLLFGALKARNVSGYLSLLCFIICPAILCLLFTGYHTTPTAWAVGNYSHFKHLNTGILGNGPLLNIYTSKASILLTRIIAFAYTYHYLNWFSKTSVIHWHHISVTRASIIGIVWAASIALYFYNYNLGIKWLFMLSLVHVILEFPLDQRSFIGIGRELKARF